MPKAYTEQQLLDAIDAVKEGISYRSASRQFNVPVATLNNHLKGRSTLGKGAGRTVSIPRNLEEKVVASIMECARVGFPMTKARALLKIGMLCKKLGLATPFKGGIPQDKYWRCLKKRFPNITIRNPECCNHKRLTSLSPVVLRDYFDDLHRIIGEMRLSGDNICNMDETGLQFTHRPSKVVAKKGTKALYSRTSDTKESVTVIACVNAAGRSMPPGCVVRGKTKKSVATFNHYLGPQNAFWTHQERGWMDNSLGVAWFEEIFLKNCGPQRPQLLLLDSHSSHEVLELLQKARREQIHIFALPPHTTHKLQPLDKVVFRSFKARYNSCCTTFMFENPTKAVNKQSFPHLLGQAWEVFQDSALIQQAFRSTGVYPPNRYAVGLDMLPARHQAPSTSSPPLDLDPDQTVPINSPPHDFTQAAPTSSPPLDLDPDQTVPINSPPRHDFTQAAPTSSPPFDLDPDQTDPINSPPHDFTQAAPTSSPPFDFDPDQTDPINSPPHDFTQAAPTSSPPFDFDPDQTDPINSPPHDFTQAAPTSSPPFDFDPDQTNPINSPSHDFTQAAPSSSPLDVEFNFVGHFMSISPSPLDFNRTIIPSTSSFNSSSASAPPKDLLSLALRSSGISSADDQPWDPPTTAANSSAILPEFQVTASWNSAVQEIFSPPTFTPTTTGRSITGHRFLTSNAIIQEKIDKEREREYAAEKKEVKRKEREERRLEKARGRGGRGGRGRGRK